MEPGLLSLTGQPGAESSAHLRYVAVINCQSSPGPVSVSVPHHRDNDHNSNNTAGRKSHVQPMNDRLKRVEIKGERRKPAATPRKAGTAGATSTGGGLMGPPRPCRINPRIPAGPLSRGIKRTIG